ncbi:MAG: hypothetical protein V9E82_15385 [Candidatus Nanopelagicales bacterium]
MKSRYASDAGLTARMTGTMFMLGLLYVVFIGLLIAVGLNAGFVLILAIGLLFAQWYFSDTVALHSMGAREVTPDQAPQLHGDHRQAVCHGRHAQATGGHRRHRHA